MGVNREDAGLCVKMSNGGHPHAAGRDTEGRVLEGLKFGDGGRGGIGKPDWGRVGKQGPNEGLKSDEEGFLLLAPAGTS